MIEYIVNKEKRTVVALIKFGKETEESFKESYYIADELCYVLSRLKNTKNRWMPSNVRKAMFFPTYMSAKARCNPNDEWDEEEGKRIARERLVEKIRNHRSKAYKVVAEIVAEIQNIIVQH